MHTPRRPTPARLGRSSKRESERPALRIFLSYRRDDAGGHAGRLYDMLAQRYGPDHVFMDIDAIPLGSDFGGAIDHAVSSCDVLIALIGRTWLQAAGPGGQRRLEKADDYVRREIEAALKRGIVVVPACVQAAEIPRPEELPVTLAPMTKRQGIELRDAAWQDDVARLMRRLETVRDEKANHAEPTHRPTKVHPRPRTARLRRLAILGVLAVAAGAVVIALPSSSTPRSSSDAPLGPSERRLLALIPEATRPSCSRGTDEPIADAHLSCDIASTINVDYYLFTHRATAEEWYALSRTKDGVNFENGNCTPAAFHGQVNYSAAGRTAGQYYCLLDPQQHAVIVALDRRVSVGLRAADYHDSGTGQVAIENVLKLWTCCIQVHP